MYVGHFAAALAIKAHEPRAPTWALLVGVGLLDLLFGPLVLAGIERATLTPGVSPGFSLDYIDWSHSLLMSLVWFNRVRGSLRAPRPQGSRDGRSRGLLAFPARPPDAPPGSGAVADLTDARGPRPVASAPNGLVGCRARRHCSVVDVLLAPVEDR